MVSFHPPQRLQWAVQVLNVAPEDEILEIGCGPGVAVSLVCEQLAGGKITAIDRSATAIKQAAKRNADHLASGKAALLHIDLAALAVSCTSSTRHQARSKRSGASQWQERPR